MRKLTNRLTAALISGAALIAAAQASAADGVTINHLGPNNTLVRVIGDDNFLILPVQETIDDARVNVLVDGKIAETIFVRLAQSKTDYSVPYDLSRFKGHNVVLDIVASHGRSSIREAKDAVCWEGIHLADSSDTTDRELKYRPVYHHTPIYGWMNDPNGMFYKDGKWHLYYQYNPYGSKWQNMSWGHSTSPDLINWTHEPEALRPDGLGSIFSGSCVIDHDNTAGFGKDAVVALYTSAGTSQMQSLAHSNDNGQTFEVYPGNPILTLESEARDPNMFWNEQTKEWNLVLAHALDHEILFFTSPNLKDWTLQSAFGKGIGAQDGVWECPDLFKLPVDNSGKEKWVLLVNLNPGGIFGGSATQYFIGDFDGHKFTADTDAQGTIPTKWMDFGKDHYATVTWSGAPDNRRTAIGWMSNWQYAADVPTKQFRSANTLPRDLSLFTAPDGEIYLASAPSPEVDAIREKASVNIRNKNVGSKPISFNLPVANSGICEIDMEIAAKNASDVTIMLSNKASDKVVMNYDAKTHTIDMDRRESGVVNFSENFPAVTVSPTFETDGRIALRLFIDRSSIELFGNDGKFVMTNLVFPNEPYSTLSVNAKGDSATIESLKVYPVTTSSK